MAYLRIGYMLANISWSEFNGARVLELGPGNGVQLAALRQVGCFADGLDLHEQSLHTTIPRGQAERVEWDILLACDVLEHFHNIDGLWRFPFKYAYISTPALPDPASVDLSAWRHFKPDEHVYYIEAAAFHLWAQAHKYHVLAFGCPEDVIRARWNASYPNIHSFIMRRNREVAL